MEYSQAVFRARSQSTRDGRNDGQNQSGDEEMFSIHVLKQLSSAKRHNEANRTHRQEAEGGVAGVELVDLLCDEHDVVNDILVCAVSSYSRLANCLHYFQRK